MGGYRVVAGCYRWLWGTNGWLQVVTDCYGWFQVVTGAYEWLLVVMGSFDDLQ